MDRFTKREMILLIALIALAGLLFFGRQMQDVDLSEIETMEAEPMEKNGDVEHEAELVVHIAGEVFEPGVYALRSGARVIEAIQAAGGETNFANLEKLNLARILVDGEQIIVPSTLETDVQVAENQPQADGKVNINRAKEMELEGLTGIGPTKAQAIIDYRTQHPFQSIEEIQSVSGIGQKTYEKICDQITIN
ncbi:helix-hairpin-helix domain-containing protein [Gottschalkiaceae bacterium SANA]|nr:helix-hairpin-helix domain-containing protein [Gottschalkiaceae bacterium SANA]